MNEQDRAEELAHDWIIDEMAHRKRSKKVTPKKSDHKHYRVVIKVDVLFETADSYWVKVHERCIYPTRSCPWKNRRKTSFQILTEEEFRDVQEKVEEFQWQSFKQANAAYYA